MRGGTGGVEVKVKVVTGIDDNTRSVVSAKAIAQGNRLAGVDALLATLRTHGVSGPVLTDSDKAVTGVSGRGVRLPR